MQTKDQRLETLRRIVKSHPASTQGELARALRGRGMRVDQSTLSRDLAELGIRKAAGRYALAGPEANGNGHGRVNYAAVVRGFTPCGPHLIVVRTLTGQAQPVAVDIDQKAEPAILATLAGDDTIFLATKSRRAQAVALRRLEHWFGDKHER